MANGHTTVAACYTANMPQNLTANTTLDTQLHALHTLA